jgi:succinate dehydrogenase/fumarate reductase flavoprotein subunit
MRSDDAALPEIVRAASVPEWHDAADVLVVGYGMAGACAALEAADAGAEVLIVERYSGFGGTTAAAGGHFYLGGGTPVQEACGIDDTAEEMEKFLTAVTPHPIPEKIHAYSVDSVAHFRWLEAQGIPFERSFYPHKTIMQPGTEGLIWSGNEEVFPFRERARPAPRGHKVRFPDGEGGGGFALRFLAERNEALGVRLLPDARVDALVSGPEGICGVRVRMAGGQNRFLQARRGVVLAGGGFGQNRAMVEKYIPQYAAAGDRVWFIGAPGDDGSAIRLGQSAGGRAIHMQELFATCYFYPPADLLKGILVNRNGERFVAEDSYHSRTAVNVARQPDGIAYLILDQDIFAYPANQKRMEQELVDAWETIEEMEAGLDLPRGSLVATMAAYNADCERGVDSGFGKHPKRLKPLTSPPYAAFDLSFGRARYRAFTLGGLETTLDGGVVNGAGEAIAGLFAAGGCASNIAQESENYASGTCLGQASYFGRRAGLAAANHRAQVTRPWRA